jgi:hypothetical protein
LHLAAVHVSDLEQGGFVRAGDPKLVQLGWPSLAVTGGYLLSDSDTSGFSKTTLEVNNRNRPILSLGVRP